MDQPGETQPKGAWRTEAFFCVLFAAAYGLLFSRFLPSNRWAIDALYLTGVIFLAVFLGMLAEPADVKWGSGNLIRNRWGRALVVAVGVSLFGYFAVAVDCGQLLNFFIGIEADENHLVTGWFPHGTRTCAHPIIGNRFFPNSALCGLPYPKEQLQPGTVLRLYGRASWLGIQIESTKIIQPVHLPDNCCERFPSFGGFELQMPSENVPK